MQDTYTSYGAGILAKTIEKHWHERGARHVRVSRFEIPGMPGLWAVRSNLVNGLPPKSHENLLNGVVAP